VLRDHQPNFGLRLLGAWELYGMDGSTVRVPDTPENRETFGGQAGTKVGLSNG